MTPLGKVVVGSLLVILDFRVEGFDLVPDLVGWPVVLAGLLSLAGRSVGFAAAAVAAGIGILLAVPQQFSEETGWLILLLTGFAETAVVFGTCTGIMAVVADPRARRTADRIRWADLGITVVSMAVGLAVGERVDVSGGAVVPLVLFVLVGLAVVVWFLVFAWTHRRWPELGPGSRTAGDPEPSTP